LHNQAFIDGWTIGFDELKNRAAAFTPERVVEICWLEADKIRVAAHLFGQANHAVLYTFIGATMGGNSISAMRLMGFLPCHTRQD